MTLRIPQKKISNLKEKAQKILARLSKKSKVQVKRELRHYYSDALEHLEKFNRIDILPEKIIHLAKAKDALEECLKIRPGNRSFRQQLRLCDELTFQDRETKVEIVLDKEWLP
jgi:DNA-directed RNA polymerase subunit F